MAIKRDQADIWFSKAIRLRDRYQCQHTGKQFAEGQLGLECCHIYGRANKIVRWDPMNAISMSHASHRYFTANPLDFHRFLVEKLGEGHLQLLNERSRGILKTNKALRKEIARHYRQEYNRMLEGNTRDLIGF